MCCLRLHFWLDFSSVNIQKSISKIKLMVYDSMGWSTIPQNHCPLLQVDFCSKPSTTRPWLTIPSCVRQQANRCFNVLVQFQCPRMGPPDPGRGGLNSALVHFCHLFSLYKCIQNSKNLNYSKKGVPRTIEYNIPNKL